MVDEQLLSEIMDYADLTLPFDKPIIIHYKGDIDYGQFQSYLKFISFLNQNGKCICGRPMREDEKLDLHHAIITRADVLGSKHKNKIHNLYNVLTIHSGNCHTNAKRKDCMKMLWQIYGYDKVFKWYSSQKFQIVKERRMTNAE